MAELLDDMRARKSIQQINTSMDDDTIIDMLHSSKLQRYFGVEIEEEVDITNTYRRNRIKNLWNNNERKGTEKSRRGGRSRTKTRKRQGTKYNHNYYNDNEKKGRSRSVGSVQTKGIMTPTPTNHNHKHKHKHGHTQSEFQNVDKNIPKKVHRLVSWFEKLNYTPSKSPRSDIGGMYDMSRSATDPKNKHNKMYFSKSPKNGTPVSTNSSNTNFTFNGPQTPSSNNNNNGNHHNHNHNHTQSHVINRNMQQKITWRPQLKDIYKDKSLLNALIAFMERIYCEENILFLQSVQQYKSKIDQYIIEYQDMNDDNDDDDYDNMDNEEKEEQIGNNLSEQIKRNIDFQIISIYNAYIVSNAQNQV